eukprot:6176141-Pleurochrysis_carterae.AAC.2
MELQDVGRAVWLARSETSLARELVLLKLVSQFLCPYELQLRVARRCGRARYLVPRALRPSCRWSFALRYAACSFMPASARLACMVSLRSCRASPTCAVSFTSPRRAHARASTPQMRQPYKRMAPEQVSSRLASELAS